MMVSLLRDNEIMQFWRKKGEIKKEQEMHIESKISRFGAGHAKFLFRLEAEFVRATYLWLLMWKGSFSDYDNG